MRTVTSLPATVMTDDHVWIPMSDGTRLSGRVWRPTSSDGRPVPAILEYIPYRHRDLTALRDSINHPYIAGHGYACVRVDIRGTGDSDGVLVDEYLEQEQIDAEDVLAWLAAQPWCDGQTGMMGISWGGFAALQVAARRPPSLRAVVIASFTDDRYGDDMHYMGGCMLSDNLAESSTMFAYATCPPDPAVVGDRWRDMWHERMDSSGPWVAQWLEHQRRDDYWRHASICGDYQAVECPVFAVCGWADGYSDAVFRLLENLDVPRKGLIGPWSHKYPHLGEPGPAIGFLQEVVCWWDHWMKTDASRDDELDCVSMPGEPMLRTWMQDSVPPSTSYEERPGRWVGEPSWPSPHIRQERYLLAPHRILPVDEEAEEHELTVQSPLSVGQFAGKWCSYNAPPDLPYDQREEDGGSLVFDSEILEESCEILGAPVAELDVTATQPVAMIAARLSDVAPDGSATRVTYGLLNLTHRDGHDEPTPMEPGRRYRVSVSLNGVAQSFPPGHRIRLSLSTSYWPLAWPPPRPALLRLHTGSSGLLLPVRPITEPDGVSLRPFDPPEGAPPIATTSLRPPDQRWTVSRDLVTYRSALEVLKDIGLVHFEGVDLDVGRRAFERYGWIADDFSSVRGETEWVMEFSRGDWRVKIVTRTILTCTPDDFLLHARLDGYEGDERVFSRNWQHVVPRDLV
ncbi:MULTISPECIES: CocE/NonD family hydrolase [Actinoalloteichus]|uniref:Hydrolase, CocE/NonD family n=1 Tax=Actinoalloteichus fjordicus TaxID=1612552 RepID=A0AAC9LGZ0_9PSEU|nr:MULTISPECIES: CocE/NonD family hydrolase [Actinoalloteichus]APU16680.1 putative hydrolase, CocE/NonD family [Actinoalloteichus fjordicus]APU22746.1 putative hydrolase, CocE/NonD family [Actinoalloteichus sp. GBA129-24]